MKDDAPSPSTISQRRYRERMREAGLVKKDVWILPENAAQLAEVERQLRLPDGARSVAGASRGPWDLDGLQQALYECAQRHGFVIRLMAGADPSLQLTLQRHGDLPVYLAVDGAQILVEAYLWPLSFVVDEAAFNAQVLATQKLIPLSSVSREDVGGVPSYVMYGALEAQSSLESVLFEIETLGENVIGFTESCLSHLVAEAHDA